MIADLAGPPALPKSDAGEPTFDVARIEPTGEAVIAGPIDAGRNNELLRNGELHDRAVADQSGQFVMVPSSASLGQLRSYAALQGTERQAVDVQTERRGGDRAEIDRPAGRGADDADKPTVVLSQPEAPKLTPGTVIAEAVEIESGGKFHASGRARPGGTVRLYLNEAFIASATAAAMDVLRSPSTREFPPAIIASGWMRSIRNSGAVHARAEVPFNVTANDITGSSATARAAAARPPVIAAVEQPQLAAAGTTVLSDEGSPTVVVVPKILTTKVSRGDSLWRISQLNYGLGTRYATIYKANREQIRNPNLIYPGQVFVIPNRDAQP